MAENPNFETIRDLTEACERCYLLAGFKPKEVAYALKIDYAHFVRMMNPNDPRCFPPDKIIPLMNLCNNVLPLEWMAWRMGYMLHDKSLKDVLEAIRSAMTENGRRPLFKIYNGVRVERDTGG